MDRTDSSDSSDFGPRDGSGNRVTATEARQGVTGTGTRYVLHISVALVVIAFAIIYFVMLR
ncbi:MAG TPA: hypothetical protein VHW69_03155 [Rhizomicrobium sp.]|jgi:hypothetical protein|nr:hypothetical protein [Rhizomicrobium sp.]